MSWPCDKHGPDEGCKWCYEESYDLAHVCPGCGVDLDRRVDLCRACQIARGQIEL